MRVIGITGQSGSGKGELCKSLTAYGYEHLDTDAVYHELLDTDAALVDELVRAFGADIVTDGKVNRKILATKVFGAKNKRRLKRLNQITHRYVCRVCVARILDAKARDAVGILLDAPLLFEARLDKICDTVVLVVCDTETRVRRIMARDGISEEAARTRIRAQGDPFRYAAYCDLCLVNDGDAANLAAAAEEIHNTETAHG